MGAYCGMDERDLFDMEYRTLQHTKLQGDKSLPLARHVALITGAAGAIGSGIAAGIVGARLSCRPHRSAGGRADTGSSQNSRPALERAYSELPWTSQTLSLWWRISEPSDAHGAEST